MAPRNAVSRGCAVSWRTSDRSIRRSTLLFGRVYVRRVLGMPVDVRANERAINADLDAARDRIVQGGARQARADALAFVVGIDFGVDEGHLVRSALVLREGDHPPVVRNLPAAVLLVVFDLH